jgi:hypothetical protein
MAQYHIGDLGDAKIGKPRRKNKADKNEGRRRKRPRPWLILRVALLLQKGAVKAVLRAAGRVSKDRAGR